MILNEKNNNLIVSLVILSGIVIGFLILYLTKDEVENKLYGRWREVSWSYEKANTDNFEITEEIKDDISQGMVIHKSELWSIKPNARLLLKSRNQATKSLKWHLEGRGNILKIVYNKSKVEYYQIYKITNNSMILNFENNIHAKGRVKIEFKKIN